MACSAPGRPRTRSQRSVTKARRRAAHHELASGMAHLRTTADRLDVLAPADALRDLQTVDAFLTDELLPHEVEEDRTIHPALARAMGSDDATAALHGTHNEIFRLAR